MSLCKLCQTSFTANKSLYKHYREIHQLQHMCKKCKTFHKDETDLNSHINEHNKCSNCNQIIKTKFKRHMLTCDKKLYKKVNFNGDVNTSSIISTLNNCLLPIKWILIRIDNFVKYSVEENGNMVVDKETQACFCSLTALTLNKDEIDQQFKQAIDKINESMTKYQEMGSGWQHVNTSEWQLHIYKYIPLNPKSYIPTPKAILMKKAVLNIRNDDNKCFLWSVLAMLHPVSENPYRVEHYKEFEHELDMSGISYPVKITDITKFEQQNSISVNVFAYGNKIIHPLRITERELFKHANLLLSTKIKNTHYWLIRDCSELFSNTTK